MINFKRAIIIILAIFYKTSCISFHSLSREIIINENQWTDKNFIFSDVSKELFKQKKINENWSSFDSDKRIPYFKLKNTRGKILGDHIIDNEKFLVINLENNKKYKWKYDYTKENLLPSHIAVFDDVENAKKIIREVTSIDEKITSLIDNKKNKFGSGGIATKLDAAKICMNSGSHMFIANGKVNNPISNMIKNKRYTHFLPKISTLDARKKWIIGSLNYNGTIYIDNGAAKALSNGKSLLAAGITKINGNFKKGENVIILDQNNVQLARGLSSFSSIEIDRIKGKQSKEIETILGYLSKTEVIHKDDMVLL